MHFSDAITEYCFDCKVRKLSPKSISNYQKQTQIEVSGLREIMYQVVSVEDQNKGAQGLEQGKEKTGHCHPIAC